MALSSRTRRQLSLGIVAGVVSILGAWWAVAGLGVFEPRPVSQVLADAANLEPREATAELCNENRLCIEGWRTNSGDFLRFQTEGQAEEWAVILGDQGRRNGAIVLDMHEVDLTFDQKRLAIEVLYSDRDWA